MLERLTAHQLIYNLIRTTSQYDRPAHKKSSKIEKTSEKVGYICYGECIRVNDVLHIDTPEGFGKSQAVPLWAEVIVQKFKKERKEALKQIEKTLLKHQNEVRMEVEKNKWEINRLAEKQTILKRKLSEISRVVYLLGV